MSSGVGAVLANHPGHGSRAPRPIRRIRAVPCEHVIHAGRSAASRTPGGGQHGSLAAAARSLGYTQPAVSHQIRRLEQEAGVRLLARDGRGVRLTDAGRALAARAAAIAAERTAAEAELTAAVRDEAGHLRIAPSPAPTPASCRRPSPNSEPGIPRSRS